MQIHHTIVGANEEWVLDPVRGPMKEKRQTFQRSTVDSISVPPGAFKSCPDGATFEVQPDGTFDVPDDVADQFLGTPGWNSGSSPFPPEDMVAPEAFRAPKLSKVSAT